MKRIFKVKIKTGFTLLETILSVAIMVIISSMLLNGFVATMGYSYHTSVYTKAAAANYSGCMNTLSQLHSKSTQYGPTGMAVNNYAIVGQIAYKGSGSYNSSSSAKPITISFDVSSATTTNGAGTALLNDLNAVEFDYTAVPSVVEINGVIENSSVAANRKTFFYIPTQNYDPDEIDSEQSLDQMVNNAYLGHVGIYLVNSDKFGENVKSGEYCWGYLPNPTDPASFVPIGSSFSMGT
ncbi:MAG: type II secretion system protein [Clostridiales bacterium]|nr:type II secretion system protein [Clostridiales bacterium]